MMRWHDARGSEIPWADLTVCVAGLGVSGRAAAKVLAGLGATVHVVDAAVDSRVETAAAVLHELGIAVHLGVDAPPVDVDLVVTSPGWRPTHPLLLASAERGVPVWGEVELASRFATQPWLGVTGTNGKTTTTEMLAAMLAADGRRVVAAGNIGTPLIDVVTADEPPDVIAVELSSFQLHWSSSLQLAGAAVLNVAPDHLDWHGGPDAYAAAKRRALEAVGPEGVALVNADDAGALALADGLTGRVVRFHRHFTEPSELGIDGTVLWDHAFSDGTMICPLEWLGAPGPHNETNALAASGLALSVGVPHDTIGEALREFRTGAHRQVLVRTVDGVGYVNDSKATNPHAAACSLAAYDRVVWIAGGLNKGLSFGELVAGARDRLVAAVLIGTCAGELRDALARHAPDVPVIDAADLHTAVEAARAHARPGDVVLLAPAAASMDMFRDYAHRGDDFAAAVQALEESP